MMLPRGIVSYTRIGLVPIILLYGPILYFYCRSLISGDFQFEWKHAGHLLPFVGLCIFRLLFYPNSFEPEHYVSGTLEKNGIGIIVIITVSLTSYWIGTLVLLAKHRQNLKNHFSHQSQKLVLNWIWMIMFLFIINHLLGFFAPLLKNLFRDPIDAGFWFFQFNLALFSYLLTIFGLLQPIIFEVESTKYSRSGLSAAHLQTLAKRISSYLAEKKPFLNPEYNLQQMSQDLDVPRQGLSQTINEVFGKNFYQLINSYRVEEVKHLLRSPASKSLTLEGLAYEAGFSSKASFYRIFKEFTGQTPAAFRRILAQQSG